MRGVRSTLQADQELVIDGHRAYLCQPINGVGLVKVNVSDLVRHCLEAGRFSACKEHGWPYQLPDDLLEVA